MFTILRGWCNRYFSDPEAILLLFLLVIGFGCMMTLGHILAPVLASIVFAYLLEWVVVQLQNWRIPRLLAVWMAFLGFLGGLVLCFLILIPLLGKQVISLFSDLPNMIQKAQLMLNGLVEHHPDFFTEEQIRSFSAELLANVKEVGKIVVTASWSSLTSLITWLVYLILVPLLVFFFLKDRQKLLNWFSGFLPHKRELLTRISSEVNNQIGNYIRGKVLEIVVVSIFTYLVFAYFGLHYSVLLAALVGFSVLIPYVGGIVITLPVFIVGYLQWGLTQDFAYMLISYSIIQGLDANILVPLLFSEAVNLHPVAIVVAILFFGGMWGFWGVFFAIPLATLVKAVICAWPKKEQPIDELTK
jgi:putative permease